MHGRCMRLAPSVDVTLPFCPACRRAPVAAGSAVRPPSALPVAAQLEQPSRSREVQSHAAAASLELSLQPSWPQRPFRGRRAR